MLLPQTGMRNGSWRESQHSVEHAGERYYFCSRRCLEKFQVTPLNTLSRLWQTLFKRPGFTPARCTGGASGHTRFVSQMRHDSGERIAGRNGNRNRQAAPVGIGAFMLLLAIYFGVVSLISGWILRSINSQHSGISSCPSRWASVSRSGSTPISRSLSDNMARQARWLRCPARPPLPRWFCCAHYLTNILPILGVTGILAVVAEYQVELFWLGLAFNAAGILYVASKVIQATKEHKKMHKQLLTGLAFAAIAFIPSLMIPDGRDHCGEQRSGTWVCAANKQ